MTIDLWLLALIILVNGAICWRIGYCSGKDSIDFELEKTRIIANARVELDKYRWDHPMNGGGDDDA